MLGLGICESQDNARHEPVSQIEVGDDICEIKEYRRGEPGYYSVCGNHLKVFRSFIHKVLIFSSSADGQIWTTCQWLRYQVVAVISSYYTVGDLSHCMRIPFFSRPCSSSYLYC